MRQKSNPSRERPWSPDDARLARALRELLRRSGQTLEKAARSAGVSRRMYRRILRGQTGLVSIETVRATFQPFDARVRISVWWNGAELDRLLDQDHAAIVEIVVRVLQSLGWLTLTEVTFSEFGERGSIDVLAFHEQTRIALVIEVKASWGSVEATNRSLDAKARLAPKIVAARFGFKPVAVGRLLVFPDESTHRRIAEQHARTLEAAYPLRGRAIRTWLRQPAGSIRGLWFLSKRPNSAAE